jgi:hypothetical protein
MDTLKIKYENVHRPETTDRGERYSVAAKLLIRNFVLKICYISQLTLQKLHNISKDPGNSCIIPKFIKEPLLWNTKLYQM